MNSTKTWDFLIILMIISFIGFIAYMKIGTYTSMDKSKAAAITTQTEKTKEEKLILVDGKLSYLNEDEMNEKSDLVVIGQIKAIEKKKPEEKKESSDKIPVITIPDIIYEVVITESIKNPTKATNIKVKCIGLKMHDYDPSQIQQDGLYKFYLVDNKDGTYSLTRYKHGIQKVK